MSDNDFIWYNETDFTTTISNKKFKVIFNEHSCKKCSFFNKEINKCSRFKNKLGIVSSCYAKHPHRDETIIIVFEKV